MHAPLVLRLGRCGTPLGWVTVEVAASFLVKDTVSWCFGEPTTRLRGGVGANGLQTTLDVPPIIATKGGQTYRRFTPALSNSILFRRDRNLCLYCGNTFKAKDLSRDHVNPQALGGRDIWSNVVTACKRCNCRKGCRTPEQASMLLLAVPYVPNLHEYTVLGNNRIVADQMDFLQQGFSSNFRSN